MGGGCSTKSETLIVGSWYFMARVLIIAEAVYSKIL
jgi:hypothetical protein